MTRVLITGDHAFSRHCLAALVHSAADLELVGECGRGADVQTAVSRLDPHVVVMPVRAGEVPGIDASGVLRHTGTRARLLLLATDSGPGAQAPKRSTGATGYLVRDGTPAAVLNAIRLVAFDAPTRGVAGASGSPGEGERLRPAAGPSHPVRST